MFKEQVTPVRRGDQLKASAWNKIQSMAARAGNYAAGGAVNMMTTSNFIAVRAAGNMATPLLRTFVVREEKDDYLVCVEFDYDTDDLQEHDENLGTSNDQSGGGAESGDSGGGDTGTTSVKVAKPRLLQQGPFQNKTINYGDMSVTYDYTGNGKRNAHGTRQEGDQKERITPAYFVGDIIVARSGPTGVVVDGKPITWQDINEGGRQWAFDQTDD